MEAFNGLLQSPWLQPAMPTLAFVALVAWFWWRTGSIRSVLDRVWHLLAGSTDVNDPILKEVLVNSRDLERFRFTYRIKVDSLDHVHKLHAWSQQHRLDIATVSKAREWVDVTRSDLIKEPPSAFIRRRGWLAGLLLATVYGLGALLLPSGALLRMKASGTYFRLQESSLQHPLWLWSVASSDCKTSVDAVVRKTGFTKEETGLMCGMLQGDGAKSLIEENQATQRWLFVVALIPLGFWFFSTTWQLGAARAALALRRRAAVTDQGPEDEGVEP
ncbi:DUF6216 family protein [Hydrogenophaga pseudoflava]|uniref:DUF6216 family protein n=1 Tax=Hydrogenophaga pseudoflava TaxID=47421 RepID=UPI0027E439C0|nr:DUF6216 family protein [Hydrogenophaga pseudoflava]MDQ7746335.1 DUF6216 family protein [Hydrogenophaga pseudoflava]